MERFFKGIWIPAEIWLNNNLSIYDKAIFAEVESLDGPDHCFASNEYLSEFCQVSKTTVTRSISKLISYGYLEIVSFDGRQRVIKVNPKYRELKIDDDTVSIRVVNENSQHSLKDEADKSPSEFLLYNRENRENNIEAPATQAPQNNNTKNHSRLYNQEIKTLSDDLESGKDIDAAKRQNKKVSLLDKCMEEIDSRPYSDVDKQLLKQYVEWAVAGSDPRRITNVRLFRQKLDALDQICKRNKNSMSDVIQQSIKEKWYKFVEVKETNIYRHSAPPVDNYEIDTRTSEERQAEFDALDSKIY